MQQVITAPEYKVHLISLGCARNLADSEVMLGSMIQEGWKIVNNPQSADAVVINTCSFIGAAKEESIDSILSIAELKKEKPALKLVVTGCLTQRYKHQLTQGLPEVDLFIGTDEFPRITELLKSTSLTDKVFARRTNYLYDGELPKLNTLSKHSAYVKVAEGCQHKCAFCIIPAIRGKLRSRPIENVVKEVRRLTAQGVIEINLIAQDLAAYGRDGLNVELLDLLKALVNIDGLQWIRMLYMYPENITAEFLDFFAGQDKLVKYLDVPVQHANDQVLRRMNRDIDRQGLENIFRKLRDKIPEIALRTSVMVGFPGETEKDFEELCEFLTEQKFDHLGCFSYSQEEGTVAARLPNQIAENVKMRRHETVMTLQQKISKQNLTSYLGQTVPVLVEGSSQEIKILWQGRMATQAPEVDGVVYINDGSPRAGEIQNVLITETHEYDLVGKVTNS